MPEDKKYIRFTDFQYNTIFYVPDGGKIRLDYPEDSEEKVCKYIDEYHFYLNTTCYHIHEFAELSKRGLFSVEPIDFIPVEKMRNKDYER